MVKPLGPFPPELDSTLQSLRTVKRTLSSAKVITKPKAQSYGPSGSASLDFKCIFSSHLFRYCPAVSPQTGAVGPRKTLDTDEKSVAPTSNIALFIVVLRSYIKVNPWPFNPSLKVAQTDLNTFKWY